jgi:hypothetical protein
MSNIHGQNMTNDMQRNMQQNTQATPVSKLEKYADSEYVKYICRICHFEIILLHDKKYAKYA